jgi:toxin ParE1/3/4
MSCDVFLTADAACDLEELYQYIDRHDAPGKAEHVLTGIEEICNSLSGLPERGAYPKELLALGIHDYREVFFKPYRVIYRVTGDTVYVLLIVDGRRDMQTLLLRRLLKK